MKRIAALAAALMWMSPAHSNECISIDNDLDRLACYDRASNRTPKIESASSPGKWVVETQTSALTDRANVVAALESEEVVNCGWNRGDKILLIARCMENTTSIYFNTGCHMTDLGQYGEIQYRLDDEKAQTIRANNSTNNRSLGLWQGHTAIPLIKKMLNKERLVAKMTPYGENSFTVSFNLSGMVEATAQLRKECGW